MAEAMPIEKNNIPIGLPIITSLGKKSLNQISKIKKIQNWLKIFCKKEVKKSFNISISHEKFENDITKFLHKTSKFETQK